MSWLTWIRTRGSLFFSSNDDDTHPHLDTDLRCQSAINEYPVEVFDQYCYGASDGPFLFCWGGGGVLLNYTCLVELYRAPLNMEVPKVSLFSHIIDFGEIIFPSND